LSSDPSYSSYHDIPPLEIGGVVARRGFYFQDHVAAGYCIDMLQQGSDLKAVWCEALDDVTLVRDDKTIEKFEFVQVKNNESINSWSVAQLCKRDKKGVGSSILEKSLAYERGSEPCFFRIVTCLRVNKELEILALPLTSQERIRSHTNFTKLSEKIENKLPGCQSPNGSDTSSWLSRTTWEVSHAADALENKNLLKLRKNICSLGMWLAEDQWDELYRKVLHKVQEAGRAEWKIDPEAKKICRDNFLKWIQKEVERSLHPSAKGTGVKLSEKMKKAAIPYESIEIAKEQRRAYRNSSLGNSYMDLSKRTQLEQETSAHLNLLLSQLDAGKINDDGIEFHTRCLEGLSLIKSGRSDISLAFLQGYMYNLADRCVYRFTTKVAP
jgi:Cap4 dsDNA endonuclease